MTVYSGIWTSTQQLQAKAAGNWPTGGGGPLQVDRSLRFNESESTSLNRTPGSAGNQKTWTWSGWVKKTEVGTDQIVLEASDGTNYTSIYFDANHYLTFYWDFSGSKYVRSSARYRDPSAWYHIVVAVDTTQALFQDRVKMYVNGAQVISFSTYGTLTPNVDTAVNGTVYHSIGARYYSPGVYFNGYMANIDLIDGQQLNALNFGQYNATTGVWEPIAYTGTYGTNGFHLDFSDNTSTTTIGYDTSGNGNNWTANNFSVTDGADNDSLVDTPTPYGTDTGAGGEVGGNYATLNPLAKGADASLSNGNLDVVGSGTAGVYATVRSTIQLPTSGKWYCEFRINAIASGNPGTGILADGVSLTSYTSSEGVLLIRPKGSDNDYPYWVVDTTDASVRINTTAVTAGNIFQVIYDADNLKVWMGINNTYYGISGGSTVTVSGTDIANGTNPAYTLSSTKRYYFGGYVDQSTDGFSANFGQRPFAHTAPSGFKALCTTNLPAPTIVQPANYFDILLYGGNSSTQTIGGLSFQPDFVWIKNFSGGSNYSHTLYDVLRGVTKRIFTNSTNAESTDTTGLTAFNSDGFDLGSTTTTNSGTAVYVGWNWKANGAGVSNTDGTITSTVSANTDSGFSIVTYTGTGVAATIGHGLGAKPSFFIIKKRTNSGTQYGWYCYSSVLGATNHLVLNTTAGSSSSSFLFNDTEPSSSAPYVFTVGTSPATNEISIDYVAYCFAPIEGYSAFGSYAGNGSSDGPFVYTGFRPEYLLVKRYDTGSAENWRTVDNARRLYNVQGQEELYLNSSAQENSTNSDFVDMVSNGFKIRAALSGSNASGGTYIYMAFAENPFKYALAR